MTCFIYVSLRYFTVRYNRHFYGITNKSNHVWLYISSIFDSKLSTFWFYFNFMQGLYLRKRTMSIFGLIIKINKIPTTKYLATISTMMFSSVKWMKLFITFKTIINIFIRNPFLFWTKWCFYYFLYLIIHLLKEKNQKI